MIKDEHISLAHGNGGRYMRELITEIFARHLSDPAREDSLNVTLDAAPVDLSCGGEPYMTTDGFIVQPLEFPGGDIGSLAVHGTVNDLAVSGATPRFLTLNAFIEEGLEIETLDRIVQSLAASAAAAGVQVVAGDTKVLPRGEGGGLYLATTGVGLRPVGTDLGMHRIQPGDRIVVSGPVGDQLPSCWRGKNSKSAEMCAPIAVQSSTWPIRPWRSMASDSCAIQPAPASPA